MIKLDDVLAGVTRLDIDSAPIIYFVEAHPQYDPLMAAIFHRVDAGALTNVTSVIALSEVLVHPIRHRDAGLR